MAIDTATFEATLDSKIDAATTSNSPTEFLLLAKAVEATNAAVSSNSLAVSNNLSDLNNAGTARTNLGLGTMAVATASDYLTTVLANSTYLTQSAAAGYATQADIDASVSALVDSAPATLDTLNELAAALGDDANFSTTVTNSIATKLPLAGGTLTGDLSLTSSDSNRAINITSTSGIASIEIGGTTSAFIDIKVPDTEDFDTRYGNNSLNCTGDYVFQRAGGTKLAINATGAAVTGDLSVSGSVSGSYTNLHPEVTTATPASAAGGAGNVDMTKPMHHWTLAGSFNISPTNIAAGRTAMLVLDRTASNYNPSWASAVKWPNATEPTWADYRYWIVSFTCLDGTSVLASASGYTV